ncbi:MAG: hypothetical protein ACI9HK_002293 [Pirellulaceae bacterium]|jgi:hypothetical protein
MKLPAGEIVVADRIFQWTLTELPGNLMLTIQTTNCKNKLEAYFDIPVEPEEVKAPCYDASEYSAPHLLERIIRHGMKIGWASNPFYPQDLRVAGAEYMDPKY